MSQLTERMYGYELSGVEYQLIFNKTDLGFVRILNKKEFCLDPSPFLNAPRAIVYVIDDCPMPEERQLIRVTTTEQEERITGNLPKAGKTYNLSKTVYKYVRSWEEVDPNVIKIRKTREDYGDEQDHYLETVEFIDYFGLPFKSLDPDNPIEPISNTLAFYAASSQVIGPNSKGGVNAAVRCIDKAWKVLEKRIFPLIPDEFKKTSSVNFYKYGVTEEIVNPLRSKEVNHAYPNPDKLNSEILISLGQYELRPYKDYREDLTYLRPMARAFQLDMLLFSPRTTTKTDKVMLDNVYDMRNKVLNAGYDVNKIDLGMTVPKLSASYARMNLKPEISKEHIESAYHFWFDAFEQALGYTQLQTSSADQSDISRLGSGALTLYTYLEETYGVETAIPKTAVYETKIMSAYLLEEAIEKLLARGFMIYPNTKEFKLLSLK
ncbi:MAG TPA: hypothetical protein HA306_01215 [Methanosarcina sp.]|nr:hypothetical protein [Methanosarcina sp.]